MPMFQDPDCQAVYDRWSDDPRGWNQELVRKFPRGIPPKEGPRQGSDMDTESPRERETPEVDMPMFHANDRTGLIRYLKSADASPSWASNHLVCCARASYVCALWTGLISQQAETHSSNKDAQLHHDQSIQRTDPETGFATTAFDDLGSPADIERPRSALHSGDFREGSAEREKSQPSPAAPVGSPCPPLSSSPTTPWYSASVFASSLRRQDSPAPYGRRMPSVTTRSRAPSFGSFSSSYVLKAPTTPLVHQANNTDLDFSPKPDAMDLYDSFERVNRRRTLPSDFHNRYSTLPPQPSQSNDCPRYPRGRRDSLGYYPQFAQRSMTSAYTLQLASSLNAPVSRARRPSFSSDKSHAPLVGSYEESILRGRMSMNPSKPLDFTAQIGVLGRGKCKSNLKCPPHVTIPFPAVFYSYPTSGTGRSISDDNPSPYVGMIDIENSLPRDDTAGRRRRRHHSPNGPSGDHLAENTTVPKPSDSDARRWRSKRIRRAESPKSPTGGCYRIPQQGQLQIMIKNPNKTAVKLFLVPYDLSDMEPGTKTFIRQRSYSAGPVIDMPLSARTNYGTDRPEASLNTSEDPKDKPILRYLIHLNICCPSKGRFYVHSSIRVVFANRVPDGKEQLRNEIQHPDPRYTPYKPSRDAHMGAKSGADKAWRRSTGMGMGQVPGHMLSTLEHQFHALGTTQARPPTPAANTSENRRMIGNTSLPFQPIPSLQASPPTWNHDSLSASPYESFLYHKLSRGDVGYGGFEARGESLLAKRLRGLDVQRQSRQHQHQHEHLPH